MIKMLYEPFRKWSEKGSVYLMGDTHFDDLDCKLMNPNWPSPDEQIKIINSICYKDDTFVLLGDVGNPEYIKRLKAGHKVLIMGNHDLGRTKYDPYFDEVYEGPLMIAPKIILSHEPVNLSSDFSYYKVAANIHGHVHGDSGMEDYYHSINLTSDVIGYTPVSLAMLIKNSLCSDVKDIHRQIIDNAIHMKEYREKQGYLKKHPEEVPTLSF